MIRILALLCLAAPAFGAFGLLPKWEKKLNVRFDINPIKSTILNQAFMELPETEEEAKNKGWVKTEGPKRPGEYASLVTYRQTCDVALCLLYDDNGDVAGLQITINPKQTENVVYDWEAQGYVEWIIDGELHWATTIYFCSEEYLKQDAAVRKATRDPKKLLQDKVIVVTDSYGQLHAISTDPTEIADTSKSNFTEQACMVMMGHHYYYKMTKTLECSATNLFKVFPLLYAGRLVGFGAVILYGKYINKKGCTYYFEVPDEMAVKAIVPRGPQCLYDLAKNPGLVTLHTYFIKGVTDMNCLS